MRKKTHSKELCCWFQLLPLDPESTVDLVNDCDCSLLTWDEDLLRFCDAVWSPSGVYDQIKHICDSLRQAFFKLQNMIQIKNQTITQTCGLQLPAVVLSGDETLVMVLDVSFETGRDAEEVWDLLRSWGSGASVSFSTLWWFNPTVLFLGLGLGRSFSITLSE